MTIYDKTKGGAVCLCCSLICSPTVSKVFRGQSESTALFCFAIQPPYQQLANSLCAEVGIQSLRGGGSPCQSAGRYSLLIAQGVNLIISLLSISPSVDLFA